MSNLVGCDATLRRAFRGRIEALPRGEPDILPLMRPSKIAIATLLLLAPLACGSSGETGTPTTSDAATSSTSSTSGASGTSMDGGAGGGKSVVGTVVSVSGYRIMIEPKYEDGTVGPEVPWDMKGIAWSPFGAGEGFDGSGKVYSTHAMEDIDLMAAAHINTVRTYDPFERSADGLAVLDALHARGMKAAMTVFAGFDGDAYAEAVATFKAHPAVLLWIVGNEWNYNKLYSNHTLAECVTRVNEVIAEIKAVDQDHPVAVGWGEVPSAAEMAAVPDADLWALNLYPYLDFGARFSTWKGQTTKPMFVSEYGADAFDDKGGGEDQAAQAKALESLTVEIRKSLSAKDPENPVVGGCPYEWNDEWWKSGDPSKQDDDGFPNQGVYPDGFANEEWWGIVTASRAPRAAYTKLQMLYQ